MKNKIKLLILVVSLFIVVGCNKTDDPKKQLLNSLKDINSYHLEANMTVYNEEDQYDYTLDVLYKEEDLFKVSMKNKANNHEQIVLRNADGVYVLTPSLNKSFKFQSEWPYNDSQAYLLQTIISDIKEDKDAAVVQTDSGNMIKSKVNYLNNSKLVEQNVYLDSDNQIVKVEVVDQNGMAQVVVEINSCTYNEEIEDSVFDVENNMTVSNNYDQEYPKELSTVVYPLYIPENTYLTSQDKVKKDNGERLILNFSGDKTFTIIEETTSVSSDNDVIPMSGSIYQIADVFGIKEENSISWISNGVEYYVISENLTQEELMNVANSMSVLPLAK
ncbi:MAG: outer membrane lipoprotein carrier protein LolA [Bacilli bacterium]|nr:outer membrane lipoprotein carrier protein LolA [Bacilli bacterium]